MYLSGHPVIANDDLKKIRFNKSDCRGMAAFCLIGNLIILLNASTWRYTCKKQYWRWFKLKTKKEQAEKKKGLKTPEKGLEQNRKTSKASGKSCWTVAVWKE